MTRCQYITVQGGQQDTDEDIDRQASPGTGTGQAVPLTNDTHRPALKAACWGDKGWNMDQRQQQQLGVIRRPHPGSPKQIPGSPGKSVPQQ